VREGVLLMDGSPIGRARKTANAFERARGLLGRPSPDAGSGLLIAPCDGIHTWAMAYPIDAVFLDGHGQVVRVAAALPPWRFARCPTARAVLEFAAGEAARLGVQVGCEIAWKEDCAEN